MGTYIEQVDLELRLTARVLAKITDDDRDASADAAVVDRVIADAESYCEARIMKSYGEANIEALRVSGPDAPHEFRRLCVDAAEYMLYARHPDYIRGGWVQRKTELDKALDGLRMTEFRLPPTDAETAVNPHARGEHFVDSGNTDPECDNHMFLNGVGIFSQ